MKKEYKTLLIGVSAIIVLDAVGSICAKEFHFAYGSLAPVSFLIYFMTAFEITRAKDIKPGILSSTLLGAFDASVGWLIARLLGPKLPQSAQGLTFSNWLTIFIEVTILATLIGVAAGGLATLWPQKQEQA
jgi:ABC-type enterochelin transport system permease subunit